jgi:dCMP deaminase
MTHAPRPDAHEYFMGIALAVRRRADCTGNRVGAVIVKDRHIVSTGYNGTPSNMPNCSEGGCHRCAHREQYASGTGYDLCICVHAEQNALLQAAKLGYSVQGSHCYTTLRPCFGCLKELYQAGVERIRYLNRWSPSESRESEAYDALLAEMAAHGVAVEGLELPERLLDLRASA